MDYESLLQPRSTNVLQDAGFLRRSISFLLDLLIIDLFIAAPFTPLFTRFVGIKDFTGAHFTNVELAAVVIIFLIIYAYYVLFEYLLGQTLGMMLVNTRLSGEARISTLLVRNSFILPFFPFIIFWIIEPVAILFWRRGTLEQITKTRTVHQRNILI